MVEKLAGLQKLIINLVCNMVWIRPTVIVSIPLVFNAFHQFLVLTSLLISGSEFNSSSGVKITLIGRV